MNTNQNIFGTGVIGSVYALRFAQYGLDVTMPARGKRLDVLRKNGLLYNEGGITKQIPIKTIERYESWLEIVGDRLLPGFPGAGGGFKGDVCRQPKSRNYVIG